MANDSSQHALFSTVVVKFIEGCRGAARVAFERPALLMMAGTMVAMAAASTDGAAQRGPVAKRTHAVAAGESVSADTPLTAAWRESVSKQKPAAAGCYKAQYPGKDWQALPCDPAKASAPLRRGAKPLLFEAGADDYTLNVPNPVQNFSGSFPTVTGVTGLTGGPGSISNFELQLNVPNFNSPVCATRSSGANCGAVQFLYSNTGKLYIEYQIFNYTGGCTFPWFPGGSTCYFDTAKVPVPIQPVSNLKNLVLTGGVGSNLDTVTLQTAPGVLYMQQFPDNILTLFGNWTHAEFNIYGDTSGSRTNFNAGSTVGVKLAILPAGPTYAGLNCSITGTGGVVGTSESTNLYITSPCKTDANSISFTESNAPGSAAPVISSFSPTGGPAGGGTAVTLTGFQFTGATSVTIGGLPVATYTVVNDNTITIPSTPACPVNGCDNIAAIEVFTPQGSGFNGPFRRTAEVDTISPSGGGPGTKVTANGHGFYTGVPTPLFQFGGNAGTGAVNAQNVYCPENTRDTQCTMTAPPSNPGSLHVIVNGSPSTYANTFTYFGPATVTKVIPDYGSVWGGTTVTLQGTNFTENMQAAFGGIFVNMQGQCPTSTQCTVTTPPSSAPTSPGYVQVQVANLDGTNISPPSNDEFRYLPYPHGTMQPHTGPPAGGTKVTVSGINLGTALGFMFDFNFGGTLVPALNTQCNPAPSGSLPLIQQVCTFTTPPLSPAGDGPVVIPVTATANNGWTSTIGGFTYQTPPGPPETCQQCVDSGGVCSVSGGKFVCKCQKSSPSGSCF